MNPGYEHTPDDQQRPTRFQTLNAEQIKLHDAIKTTAQQMEKPILSIKPSRSTVMAIESLQDVVAKAVVGLLT